MLSTGHWPSCRQHMINILIYWYLEILLIFNEGARTGQPPVNWIFRMELASLWCINARWLLEEYEGLGGKNSLRMCTHHTFTVFYSLIFSIQAASALFCTLSLFLQFPRRWFYHGFQMSSSAQQSQKRQSAKMIVRNEQNNLTRIIGNLLVFPFRRISPPYPRVILAPDSSRYKKWQQCGDDFARQDISPN